MSRAWLALVLAASVIYLALVASQLNRPLMYDDANFALAARAVADTGLPYGNQGWMSERGDFSQREQWALWHPPLYVYLLGLFAKLGGVTPDVMRLPGLLGGLATGGLTAAVRDLVGIGFGGVLLFAVTFVAAGGLLGFPLNMPFGVNLSQWQDS